ncbi:hypothetical protein HY478_02110 [Candidatus Uhrbacteria bacterium]|nr:hypothetical protein [Candidatus Uhrbacteria bacterium]
MLPVYLPGKEKDTDLEFFETLFRSIWARIVPILGILNVKTMLEHALEEGRSHHPVLNHVRIREDGVRLVLLKQAVSAKKVSKEEVQEGLRDFLTSLVHLLARLSGDIVSTQVREVIEHARQKRKIKEKLL